MIAGLTVEKFLKKIGRGCEEHASKFNNWEELMAARTLDLKLRDIQAAQRKWILKVCYSEPVAGHSRELAADAR